MLCKLVKFIGGNGGTAGFVPTVIFVQGFDITLVVNSRLVPVCQYAVRIFETVTVRGKYRALAGRENHVIFKAVEPAPAVNIRHFCLCGHIVLSETAHNFIDGLIVFSSQRSGLLLGGNALLSPAYGHFFYVAQIPLAAVNAVLNQIISQILREPKLVHDEKYGAHIVCTQRLFQILLRHKKKSCGIFICLKVTKLICRVIWLFHRKRLNLRLCAGPCVYGRISDRLCRTDLRWNGSRHTRISGHGRAGRNRSGGVGIHHVNAGNIFLTIIVKR